MTETEKVEAVARGEVSVEQMRQGVLEGPDIVRQACWKALAHQGITNVEAKFAEEQKPKAARQVTPKRPHKNDKRSKLLAKQRFGLPKGFVPRPQREQTNILLANNVYRLPNGAEVVPCHPTGTLGRLQHHLYALLTPEQFRNGAKGSRYVRTDGRIFDYSVDDVASGREMFDTGLTVRDLERTGNYVIGAEVKRVGKQKTSCAPRSSGGMG